MKKPSFLAFFLLISGCFSLSGCDDLSDSDSSSGSDDSLITSANLSNNDDDSSITSNEEDDYKDSLLVSVLEMKGQYGDATLFSYTYEEDEEEVTFDILIDAGTDSVSTTSAGASLPALLKEQVTDHVLDVVILSHQHTDHYRGFENSAIQNGGITEVGYVIDNGVSGYNTAYKTVWETQVRDYWVGKGATYLPIQTILGEDYDGDIEINDHAVLHFLETDNYPDYGSTGDKNDGNKNSIALCLRFGSIAFVCAGDLPSKSIEANMISLHSNEEGKPWFTEGASTVIYKAAHHGSQSSETNSQEYVSWIAPDYAWSSSAIVSGNTTASSKWTTQHPYKNAYNHIATALSASSSLGEGEVGGDHYFYNGTMGTFHFDWETISSSLSIYGEGRKNANYYDENGNLVDPEEEKDLPFYKTVFFKRNYS